MKQNDSLSFRQQSALDQIFRDAYNRDIPADQKIVIGSGNYYTPYRYSLR